MDAIIAVSLVDLSMQDCTLNDTDDALHSPFHKYPDFNYLCTAKKLLTRLNLYEIWQNELLYYGKLLQVDHVTLEAEIERGTYHSFIKYDDVSDDNIPLSASLVTSSYFNNNKIMDNRVKDDIDDKENMNDNDFGDQKVINDKLAATLKKHATLNKEKKPPPQKKPAKRKRKEVTVDVEALKKKSNKRVKKSKGIKKVEDDEHITDSDEEINDQGMLNAVPSVNDFFTELGIDLHFGNSDQEDSESIEGREIVSRHSTQIENRIKPTTSTSKNEPKSEDTSPTKTIDKLKQFQCVQKHDWSNYEDKSEKLQSKSESTQVKIETSSIDLNESFKNQNSLNKLKQFQCVEKHDLSKYEEKIEKPKSISQNTTVLLKKSKIDSNNSSTNQKSVQSSQLSIFESSDCDIDLDI